MEATTTTPQATRPPAFLGNYRILRKIGHGATSEVFLGFDPFSKREVAIKVIKQSFLEDTRNGRQNRKHLQNEAALAGTLNHPHIVDMYEAVIAGDISYIAMEFVPGGTLEQHIHSDNLLPLDAVVERMYECCRALNYAHIAHS